MFIVGMLLGIVLGIIVMACMSIGTINDYINQNEKPLKEYSKVKEENLCLYQENKDLRFEHEEIKELLLNILDRAVTCPLGNEKIALDKIKELVRDYQSEN